MGKLNAVSATVVLGIVMASVLGGCDRGKQPEGPVGAKVNGAAITVEQISAAAKGDGTSAAPVEKAVTRRALEQLVNQQLLVQQAEESKMAQDPAIARAIDNARRAVLAKAWLDKVQAAAPKPGEAEIAKFYDDNPGLFAKRRIYRLLQLAVPGDAGVIERLQAQVKALDGKVDKGQLLQQVANWLNGQGIKFRANSAVQAAEQLPMEMVQRFAGMNVGDWLTMPVEGGIQILQVAAAQEQPIDRDKAKPVIVQYLDKRAAVDVSANEIKRLRAAAKIEYFGEYQDAKTDGAQAGLPDSASTTSKPATPAGQGEAAPAGQGGSAPAGHGGAAPATQGKAAPAAPGEAASPGKP